jgi:hypothetical protein
MCFKLELDKGFHFCTSAFIVNPEFQSSVVCISYKLLFIYTLSEFD